VCGRQQDALRLAAQHDPAVGAADDADVERPVRDARDDLRRRKHAGRDAQAGESLRELGEQPGRGLVGGARPVRELDRALLARREAPDVAPELVGGRQERGSTVEQERARLGELDVVRGALEQLDAQLGLQLPDLPAQRGLGDVQPLCGAREVAVLRDRDEVAETPQVRRRAPLGS
jgi:hypothetical protein